jgi:hypothetical protein
VSEMTREENITDIEWLQGEYNRLDRECMGATPFESDAALALVSVLTDIKDILKTISEKL